MYNQDWHAVTEITDDGGNVAGDIQATGAWTAVLRMDDLPAGAPGPQVTLYGFGEYDTAPGEQDGGTFGEYDTAPGEQDGGMFPGIRVMVQIVYQVRDPDGDAVNFDYVYDPDSRDRKYTGEDLGNGTVAKMARLAVESYVENADAAGALDWNGEDPVNRKGGFVRR